MKYRLVLFDFDGTLADSFPFFASVMNVLAERHGFRKIAPHEVDRLRSLDAKSILAEVGVPLWKLPAVAASFKAMMAAQIDKITLFDGVSSSLQRLSLAGIRIAIVTSNSAANVRQVLGSELSTLVQHYECGVSMFGKRPKIRRVLADAGCRPQDALLIGDEVRDAQAATAEGVAFGAVTWGYTARDALLAQSPAQLFDSPAQIATHLLA